MYFENAMFFQDSAGCEAPCFDFVLSFATTEALPAVVAIRVTCISL